MPLPTEAPPPSARTVPIAQEHPRVGATAEDCFARCDVVELTIELTTMQRSDGAGPACATQRTQPSGRGWPGDCMARMMRKSNRARSTSDAALLLLSDI